MQIKWYGTASLSVEAGGYKILFDPYLRSFNKRLKSFPLEDISDADAIFITHPHLDHYADMPAVLGKTDCPVYTNARGVEIAKRERFDMSRIKQMEVGDEIKFGELTVKAYRGSHVEYDKRCVKGVLKRSLCGHLVKGLKLAGQNKRFSIDLTKDVFTFYLSDGEKSALIMGSANIAEGTEYPKADLLIYPYQGRSDMLEYSAKLIRTLSPQTVLLDHFDDAFPPVSSRMNAEEFKSKTESESPIKVIIPTENEPVLI